jgi:hypothetical protein
VWRAEATGRNDLGPGRRVRPLSPVVKDRSARGPPNLEPMGVPQRPVTPTKQTREPVHRLLATGKIPACPEQPGVSSGDLPESSL